MARRSKPYQPGVLVTGRRTVLAFVALLSIGLHGALGYWAWDKPVATVAEIGETQARPVRVKRAIEDEYIFTPPADSVQEAVRDAQALTEQLLEGEPPELINEPLELELELRPLEELAEAEAVGLEIELPTFELDAAALAKLEARQPEELQFGEGLGEGEADDGEGSNSRDLAGEALRQAGTGTGTGTGGAVEGSGIPTRDVTALLERPELDTQPRTIDEPAAKLDTPLAPPAIDFVDLALSGTTQLEIPDNLDNDFTYRVTRYDTTDWLNRPIPLTEEAGYFRVEMTAQRSLRKLKAMPKDVIFIIDTSASISKDWVTEVARGVQGSLVSLNEGDRFNVVLFNDKVSLLSDSGPIDATRDNTQAAGDFLNAAASVGYTDVNAAMRGLLIRNFDPKRVYQLVLISDGRSTRGVVNTRDLINLITRDNDLVASIYCVGVGAKQNRELLNFLAYRNKGYSVYAERLQDASVTIQDLMSRLRYPIIKDVRLSTLGIDSEEVFPADLPNIHQGETIRVYGRFTQPGPFTMQLLGRSQGKDVSFTFTRDLADAPRGEEQIAKDWAFWKLHDLYALIIREGERPELLEQIRDLRRKYGLKTLY